MRQRGSGDWKGFIVNTQFETDPQPSVRRQAPWPVGALALKKVADSALQG